LSDTHSFVALRHRNFRLLWAGQLVSMSGSMMQSAAILWHISLLVPADRKGLALGLVGLVRVVPIVTFSLLSGVVADALDRRRLMLVTQSFLTVVATVLAVASFAGLEAVWPIYLLTALTSAGSAFDGPARQALVPALVPREHLANAISLNTIIFQLASVVGPGVSGFVIAGLGIGWVYAFNALSFLAVVFALLAMRDVARVPPGTRADVSLASAREGLRFVFRAPILRSTMLLDFFATFFSSATALLPIFAQDILRVGARGYGWLYAAPSVGAVVASVAMVRLAGGIVRRGVWLVVAVLGYGLATVGFGLSQSFALSFLCLAATGATDTVSMVLRNIVRQLATPDHLRGRMTGVSMVFFMGGPQLGEFEAGLVANWLGAVVSVVSGGIGCLAATAWIAGTTPELVRYRRDDGSGPAPPVTPAGSPPASS
jgi:MFS family permease